MIHRLKRICVVALSIGCMCLVAACGSSSKSNSPTSGTGTSPNRHSAPAGLALSNTQRSCLKKQGVTVPTGGVGMAGNSRRGKPQGGKHPKGKPPSSGASKGTRGTKPPGGSAQNSKQRAAFKACGVTLPSNSGGAHGAGASPAG